MIRGAPARQPRALDPFPLNDPTPLPAAHCSPAPIAAAAGRIAGPTRAPARPPPPKPALPPKTKTLTNTPGSSDGTARLWRVDASGDAAYGGVEVATLEGHPEEVYALEWLEAAGGGSAPGGALLAASGEALMLWDVARASLVREYTPPGLPPPARRPKGAPPAYIFALAAQPRGGALLAATCADGVIRLWGRAGWDLTHLQDVKGHVRMGSAAGFSDDGHRLASFARDGSFVVLDVRKCVLPLFRGGGCRVGNLRGLGGLDGRQRAARTRDSRHPGLRRASADRPLTHRPPCP